MRQAVHWRSPATCDDQEDSTTTIGELFDLSGKAALVTGAAQGLGKAIALRLAEAGAKVVLADLQYDLASNVASEIESAGGKARAVQVDVGRSSDIENMFQVAEDAFGRVDILVNNAGIYPPRPFLEITEEHWDSVLQINLRSVVSCSQAAARMMIKNQRGGRIINMASMGSFVPMGELSHYDASKAAVLQLTRDMALELAPHRILVNAIAPGFIITEGGLAAPKKAVTTFRRHRLLLGRHGRPDDVAKVALFLASGAADYINGTVIVVDGGYLAAG